MSIAMWDYRRVSGPIPILLWAAEIKELPWTSIDTFQKHISKNMRSVGTSYPILRAGWAEPSLCCTWCLSCISSFCREHLWAGGWPASRPRQPEPQPPGCRSRCFVLLQHFGACPSLCRYGPVQNPARPHPAGGQSKLGATTLQCPNFYPSHPSLRSRAWCTGLPCCGPFRTHSHGAGCVYCWNPPPSQRARCRWRHLVPKVWWGPWPLLAPC